jgi:hypothetical protein
MSRKRKKQQQQYKFFILYFLYLLILIIFLIKIGFCEEFSNIGIEEKASGINYPVLISGFIGVGVIAAHVYCGSFSIFLASVYNFCFGAAAAIGPAVAITAAASLAAGGDLSGGDFSSFSSGGDFSFSSEAFDEAPKAARAKAPDIF